MSRSQSKPATRLTVGEIELLKTLWASGPATIAEVHEKLVPTVGYTTVQTRLNRLVAKGVATKSKLRPAQYRAAVSLDDVNTADLNLLVGRVNDGRIVPLVANLIQDRALSEAEFQELRALIEDAEQRQKKQEK